jgi:hypothetical protein
MIPAAFSLIVVLSNGEVKYTPGFSDLHMCLEARSLALHNETLEAAEQKAADDAAREADTRLKRMAAGQDRGYALPLRSSSPGGPSGNYFYPGDAVPYVKAAECFAERP